MCLAAYPEIPRRKPKILLWSVISEAGSRLGADGSDAGWGESYSLQPPPPPNKTRRYKFCIAPDQHRTSLGILGTGMGRGKVFGGGSVLSSPHEEPSTAPQAPNTLNFA